MRVVVEEIQQDIVCLIPDTPNEAIYVKRTELPDALQIGDVLEVVQQKGKVLSVQMLPNEKKKRLEENRLKREKLLKRKKK